MSPSDHHFPTLTSASQQAPEKSCLAEPSSEVPLPDTSHNPGATVVDQQQDLLRWQERKILAAKRASRSELSVSRGDWHKHGYAKTEICSQAGIRDTVSRIDSRRMSYETFVELYERPRIPVVITGLQESWKAQQLWNQADLSRRFGNHKFKVGADDDGYAVRLKLKHFLGYLQDANHMQDDSPMYIFDGTFGDRDGSKDLLGDYFIPEWFKEDLMQLAGDRRRPPYRWMVLGPARSGSGLHVDPLATSAWNALISGHKRWALFPPGTQRHHVLPKLPGLEREAVSWFTHVYPLTQREDWPTTKPIDIIQGPGETVYVPGGWWHTVLNLDLTIAVTHNYASTANFPKVWKHTSKGRPKMSAKWKRRATDSADAGPSKNSKRQKLD
ncbi:hypothetical protein WJX82_004027 [Trebouxia sp. C0006]